MFKVGFVDYNVEAKTHIYNNKLDIDEANSNDALRRHNETSQNISTLIDNRPKTNSRWHNWNDYDKDQSNFTNHFTFNKKQNEQTFLINTVELFLKGAQEAKLILPEEIRILVSEDGQTYKEVEHQDKIKHSDFGTENNDKVLTNGFRNERNNNASVITISFEPTFANFIRLQWKPREKANSTEQVKKHYAWQIGEIKFYDINNKKLDELKSTYINKTNEKDSILRNISNSIEKFKNIDDVSSKRYSLIKQKADDILTSFNANKESIKALDGEKFKEQTKPYLDKIKELNTLLMSVNSQNTTKDKGIEVALKSAREILDNIYTFLKNTPNVNLLEEKITKANELFDSLVQFINSENKTKALIFEKVLEVNNKFKEIENSTNMIKNSKTLLSINSDTVMVKAKTDMNNTYEVSMDLTIHKLKEQENQSLKLKLNQDEENITITEIDYNTWSGKQSDNTISSNSQGGETTENPQNNPMSATPEDSATDGNSDMSRTNTSVITKKIIFTITNNSNQSKTINLKEVLLGETKIVDLTQVTNFVIPGKTLNPDDTPSSELTTQPSGS